MPDNLHRPMFRICLEVGLLQLFSWLSVQVLMCLNVIIMV